MSSGNSCCSSSPNSRMSLLRVSSSMLSNTLHWSKKSDETLVGGVWHVSLVSLSRSHMIAFSALFPTFSFWTVRIMANNDGDVRARGFSCGSVGLQINQTFHSVWFSVTHKKATSNTHLQTSWLVLVLTSENHSLREKKTVIFALLSPLFKFWSIVFEAVTFLTILMLARNTSSLRPGYFGNEFLCTYVIFNNRQNRHPWERA